MKVKRVLSNILGFPHRRARRAAKEAFRRLYPTETIGWTTLRADEDTRYIVGVFYGSTRPPHYMFFEVSKDSAIARKLDDDEPYRPRVWR
jgi:hypothetical protein